MTGPEITCGDPRAPELALLHQRHAAAMQAGTPADSIHMLPPDELARPGIEFFVLGEGGRPVGMGALKRLDADHAEIKSMHVLAEARGRGLSRLMLDHLITHARAQGYRRLSLEAGVHPGFAAATALYAGAGFAPCGPFAGYRDDPNSAFMTLVLA